MTNKIAQSARLMPGAFVGEGVTIEADVVLGPNSVVLGCSNGTGVAACVQAGAQIGANATIHPGVTVGIRAQVEPGAVVTRSVPPLAIVAGNPARITGYVDTSAGQGALATSGPLPTTRGIQTSSVRGVTLHNFLKVPDLRGSLTVGEFDREVPFVPKRYFLVFDVPTAETRGEHAHIRCEQFLIAVRGSVSVVADDGLTREEFLLNQPQMGLYLPPMTWGIQYRYSPDAVLLVFASDYYDSADYIRDYGDFLTMVRQKDAP